METKILVCNMKLKTKFSPTLLIERLITLTGFSSSPSSSSSFLKKEKKRLVVGQISRKILWNWSCSALVYLIKFAFAPFGAELSCMLWLFFSLHLIFLWLAAVWTRINVYEVTFFFFLGKKCQSDLSGWLHVNVNYGKHKLVFDQTTIRASRSRPRPTQIFIIVISDDESICYVMLGHY